ncbi:heme exporter protein CcmB [Alicyclobacillus shizuokensis]|uniref:heme exporter protein CcmB n=1 Tax=Alicyclobacillus shizuokensis TaxID=392014 RepID=UPI00082D417C|nr:heme exporter protein CcmB [Alicyclobacillus shizuokensis]MCL6625574.1 heme exporter protein CcmB [Alicyclobacillus shizuokensis]
MTAVRVYAWLVASDVRQECRRARVLVSTPVLGVLLVLLLGLALGAPDRIGADWSAGLLWMGIFFMNAVTAREPHTRDMEFGARDALQMLPVDRSVIFYARWTTTTLFLWWAEAVTTGAFFLFLHSSPPGRPLGFVAVLAMGGACMCGVSSLLVTMFASSSLREVLLPLALFPLAVPLFLALTRLSAAMLAGNPWPSVWLDVMLGYLLVFGVLPWLVYETLLEV